MHALITGRLDRRDDGNDLKKHTDTNFSALTPHLAVMKRVGIRGAAKLTGSTSFSHGCVAANKLKRSKCEWESVKCTKLESGVIQQNKAALNVKKLDKLR